jgi:hypothetical protein
MLDWHSEQITSPFQGPIVQTIAPEVWLHWKWYTRARWHRPQEIAATLSTHFGQGPYLVLGSPGISILAQYAETECLAQGKSGRSLGKSP